MDREGLSRIVPRRRSGFGVRPGATTKELYERREFTPEGEELERESKWREITHHIRCLNCVKTP